MNINVVVEQKSLLKILPSTTKRSPRKAQDHPSDQRRVTKLRWRKKYCARGRRLIKSSCLRHNNKIKLFVIENMRCVSRHK